MKTKNDIILHRYTNEDLESYTEDKHRNSIESIVIPKAKDIAKMEGIRSMIKPFADSVKVIYQKLVIHAKQVLQIDHNHLYDDYERNNAERRISDLEKQKKSVDHQLKIAERELEDCNKKVIQKNKRWKYFKWLLLPFLGLDVLLSAKSLQNMGYSFIIAVLIGVGISIGIYLISEHFPDFIRREKNKNIRKIKFYGTFIALALLFYVLGIFRSLSVDTELYGAGASPFYFMLLNLFFTSTAIAVVWVRKPNISEQKIIDHHQQKNDEVIQLDKKSKLTSKEITEIKEELINREVSRRQLNTYASDMELSIVANYHEAFQIFKHTLMIHSESETLPKDFEADPPELQLFYQNQNENYQWN